MAINDIYRLTLRTTFGTGGQLCLNVWHYLQVAPSVVSGSEELAVAAIDHLGTPIRDICSGQIVFLDFTAENIVPSADNFTAEFVAPDNEGTRGSDVLPPFVAWSFRMNRQTSESRHGQKRFVGVAETDQDDGVAVAGIVTNLTAVASALESNIVPGGGSPASFEPRIFREGRPEVTIPEKVIPAVVQASYPISSVNYVRIGSQNTRKFGRGA